MSAPSQTDTELKDFMVVLRRALLLIVAYIDKRYMTPKT